MTAFKRACLPGVEKSRRLESRRGRLEARSTSCMPNNSIPFSTLPRRRITEEGLELVPVCAAEGQTGPVLEKNAIIAFLVAKGGIDELLPALRLLIGHRQERDKTKK
jgi:hypothetical protein